MEHSPRTADQAAGPPRQSVWNTRDAKTTEQFAYYREAVCKAFMNLTPEQPPVAQFSANVESIGLGKWRLANQRRVDEPECCRESTDAEREHSDRRQREAAGARKRAEDGWVRHGPNMMPPEPREFNGMMK